VYPSDGTGRTHFDEPIAAHNGDLLQTLQDISDAFGVDEVSAVQLPPGVHEVNPNVNTTLTWDLAADIIGHTARNTVIKPQSNWAGFLVDVDRGQVTLEGFGVDAGGRGEHGIRANVQSTVFREMRVESIGGVGIGIANDAFLTEMYSTRVRNAQVNGTAAENLGRAGVSVTANNVVMVGVDANQQRPKRDVSWQMRRN
jgi:hypothetical protein